MREKIQNALWTVGMVLFAVAICILGMLAYLIPFIALVWIGSHVFKYVMGW